MLQIRTANKDDFSEISKLNEAEVQYTSPMDVGRTELLDNISSDHWVADIDGEVAGFLLVMDHDSKYENDNHDWFKKKYEQFLYVDRIVISRNHFGQKVGSSLYKKLIAEAETRQIRNIVCEYNIKPLNEASKSFHDYFGFKEVGTKLSEDGKKQISMQCLNLKS